MGRIEPHSVLVKRTIVALYGVVDSEVDMDTVVCVRIANVISDCGVICLYERAAVDVDTPSSVRTARVVDEAVMGAGLT